MVRKLLTKWNDENREIIDSNFREVNSIDLKIMEDFLKSDPSKLDVKLNGLKKPSAIDPSNLNDYGTNYRAEVNGIIHAGWIYANHSGKVGIGLAEQETNSIAGSQIAFKQYTLSKGWNRLVLNFPVAQNQNYTLFKRNVDGPMDINTYLTDGYANTQFMVNGLIPSVGKFLDETGTYRNFSPLFEIEFITNLSQIYKLVNNSVKPPQQFYVGDNPPTDAQFWFKPVGGG